MLCIRAVLGGRVELSRLAWGCQYTASNDTTTLGPRLTSLHATPPYPAPTGAQWEKAQELFEQMQHRGCKPDAVTFSGLISSYDRAGAWGGWAVSPAACCTSVLLLCCGFRLAGGLVGGWVLQSRCAWALKRCGLI